MLNKDERLKAILVLEDGSFFEGIGFGYPTTVIGEVVFNTGMVGYTEALTDPSYDGQILVFTYPLIGNYGVPSYEIKDEWGIPIYFESNKIHVRGLVVSELCKNPSHPLSIKSLNKWLYEEKIPGIENVDTRMLTKKLREKGVMMGILKVSNEEIEPEELFLKLKKAETYDKINFLTNVSVKEPIFYKNKGKRIALIDCGVKNSIIRNLLLNNFEVIRFPYNYPLDKILSYSPEGFVICNGPGNPKNYSELIKTVKNIIEYKYPVFGICLGNQIIALSLGGNTFKLKYGHRGQNKPCIFLENYRSYVTSQNHGYAVDPNSLKDTGLQLWWINADDGTVEGLKHEKLPIISVQFHPEASPGPLDSQFVFKIFKKIIGD